MLALQHGTQGPELAAKVRARPRDSKHHRSGQTRLPSTQRHRRTAGRAGQWQHRHGHCPSSRIVSHLLYQANNGGVRVPPREGGHATSHDADDLKLLCHDLHGASDLDCMMQMAFLVGKPIIGGSSWAALKRAFGHEQHPKQHHTLGHEQHPKQHNTLALSFDLRTVATSAPKKYTADWAINQAALRLISAGTQKQATPPFLSGRQCQSNGASHCRPVPVSNLHLPSFPTWKFFSAHPGMCAMACTIVEQYSPILPSCTLPTTISIVSKRACRKHRTEVPRVSPKPTALVY